jgi:hypothetical protein
MNHAPESLISTSRSKSKIDFYKECILFQLEQGHTPRKLLYEEMDRVILKKNGKRLVDWVRVHYRFYRIFILFVFF